MSVKHCFQGLVFLLVFLVAGVAFSADLLIISAEESWLSDLDKLKRFKDASGRPTILVSLGDVLANYAGWDDAEKVKMCIKYHRETFGIKQVLLVGHPNTFPVRYTWWGYTTDPNKPPWH